MATETQHERERRAAKNQSLFREVNERVGEINARRDGRVGLAKWVCECADVTCVEHIDLTPHEYERIRQDPARFAVAPDHVVPEVEEIVERQAGYWVVEKTGEAATVAQRLDPRSRVRSP